MIVVLYLMAIVAANLLVVQFGPQVTIINAFLFIGLDLSARDRLHDSWRGSGLLWRMGLLIAVGGALSYAMNRDAAQIAIASTVAFVLSATADAILYHVLRNKTWFQRVNGSNVAGATVDSFVFPTLAFGSFLPWIVLGQLAAKIVGGFVWSIILHKKMARVE